MESVKKAKVEVVIVGAGPAGITMALRLEKLGHKVILLEKQQFPRPQLGEALSPGIWNIFEYLEILHVLKKEHYLKNTIAEVIWENQEIFERKPNLKQENIIVNREELDADLLEEVRKRNIKVFQPINHLKWEQKTTNWFISFNSNNEKFEIETKFIVDARGRGSFSQKEQIKLGTAHLCLWQDVKNSIFCNRMKIEAVENGWIWGAPLTNNNYRMMLFLESEELNKSKAISIFKREINQSKLFSKFEKLIKDYSLNSCVIQSYIHENPWQQNFVKIGDAAFTLDPLSSSGVEKAMRFSMQTAICIHTVLKEYKEEKAKEFYEKQIIETNKRHSDWLQTFYNSAWCSNASLFWKNKKKNILDINSEKDISDFEKCFYKELKRETSEEKLEVIEFVPKHQIELLWNLEFELNPTINIQDILCIEDDLIKVKKGVLIQNEEKVFLHHLEIVKLLEESKHQKTIGEFIYKISTEIRFEFAVRIVFTLLKWKLLFISKESLIRNQKQLSSF
ncbi:NAD(P)/FAD-dependent oxidoreductase [Aureivirga marina]|uniref:NAD(P)/FAD-dependent oxidoreductase n=1 Tax=Aureivirga marina TaxID=1182451 RepID=UPI0018C99F50|nr:tryptophan 7-halogenase [Aureivirga marina]